MTTILVTGAAGNLGSAVVKTLQTRRHHVHAHMRTRRTEDTPQIRYFEGDLKQGEGLTAATAGVDAVIHCASYFDADGGTDLEGTRQLIAAAKSHGTPHLVYISIVGIDRIDFSYFQTKLKVEGLIRESGLPHTTLRATQFHDFVLRLIRGFEDDGTGTIAVPAGLAFQPVALAEVAEALVRAAEEPAAGRLPDLAGPDIRTLEELAGDYARMMGRQRRIVALEEDPMAAFHDSFRQGRALAPECAVGRQTWPDYLASHRR